MKAEQIFTIVNLLALVGWLPMAILPRWSGTRRVVLSGILPLLLSAAYLALIVLFFGQAEGGFGSLADVMKLFTNEWAVLAGWIHYLAFDMLIGAWEVKDSQEKGISHLLVIPCLVLTFLLGPIGFLLYHVIRFFTKKEKKVLKQIVKDQKVLVISGAISFVTLIVLAVISMFDASEILGINRWIKPMKFAISIAIYLWTVAVYLYFVPGREGTKKVIGYGAAFLLLAELVLITMQAARGTTSHFNNSTAFNGIVFSVMGLMIVVNTALIAYLIVVYFRTKIPLPSSIVWGMRLGMILLVLASLVGGYMSVVLRHSVGVADGGPGLPFVNWSTRGGDLRIAHFFGLHALQVLPMFGWVMDRLRPHAATGLTIVFGISYFLVFTAIFLQALAGRPLWGG